MKRNLFILFGLMSVLTLNAQKHIAKAVPAKKFSGVSKHSVTQGTQAACDTLKIDSAANLWSAYYYSDGTDGYVLGVSNNVGADSLGFNVLEDANYYDVSGSNYNYVTGGLIDFAFANSTSAANLNKGIAVKVYDDLDGAPNSLLGSDTLKLSSVKTDVDSGFLTEFKFSTPIQIPANKIFYVSIDHSNFIWSSSVRDSLAILADSTNQAPDAAYQFITEYTSGGAVQGWLKTSDIWSIGSNDSLKVNLFLFPYVTDEINACNSTLPVGILNFKGSIVNNEAVLTWNTATELNNKGFEIEKSNDGKNFKAIGFVKGAGTSSSLKKYSFTDGLFSDAGTTNYYRLKQTDVDGKTSYSNIITLSAKSIANLKVYPNPAKETINISLNLTADSKVSVQVISKDGKLLLNADKGVLLRGMQQVSLNIQNIASGSYFVRIKAGDDTYTQTIIKQ